MTTTSTSRQRLLAQWGPGGSQNTLHHVYSNIREGNKVSTYSHLGQSDHLSLFLTLAYRPLIRKTKPSVRNTKIWLNDAFTKLKDCFEHTHWDPIAQKDTADYASTVLFYI